MAREVERAFATRVASLLGGELSSVGPLSDGVVFLSLDDGRRLVAKGVARQSLPEWESGRPWAELVALDALSAVGGPVPKLVAADLDNGWLVTEYVAGEDFDGVLAARPGEAFVSLARGLIRLEEAFASEWEHLKRWAVHDRSDDRSLAVSLAPLLAPGARQAWSELAEAATVEDQAGSLELPGPTDVQAANVVWGREVTFLDMASYGYDVTEKRLSAYAQRAGKRPASLIDQRAYAAYVGMRGERAALRLAFYDLLYWGVGLSRLVACIREPGAKAASVLVKSWGDPNILLPRFAAMWMRERLPDPRIEQVRRGLLPVQEASP